MQKPGRNDPCPCGSNKKYKQCCLQKNISTSSPIAVDSRISDALNVAAGHFEAGKINEAVAVCQRVLQLHPEHAATLNLLGIMAFQAGNSVLAINLLNRSIKAKPDYADAHNNLGVIYKDQRALNQAASCFKRALGINPNYVDALINYGSILQDLQRHDEALAQYRHILTIQPNHTGALSNLGNALQELNRHSDAIEVFTRLLNIEPDYDNAHGGLVYSKMHCCDWKYFEHDVKHISAALQTGKRVSKPFELLPVSDSAEEHLACASIFARHHYPALNHPATNSGRYRHDKIRLAYLSADFRQHPVSQLLVEIIEQHDREKLEIIGISFGNDDQSELRDRIVKAFDRFIDVQQKSDDEVALMLQDLEIDIAVDLMGFTTNGRTGILARRAAPIQVNFLGYAGTTGADYIDYIIADHTVIPEEDAKFYLERIVRLPDCFQPNDSKRIISDKVPLRGAAGLPEEGFVFCAFNNHYKITPHIFDIWMRLLNKVEGSVLWLSPCTPVAKDNLLKEAKARGVSSSRIIFAERTALLSDHLARHQLADLFLDTLPYNAHTTASDALWAGLPILTCKGHTFAGRVAASLLHALGLPELIVNSPLEYELLALKLASDKTLLSKLRNQLRKNRDSYPLFNTHQYLQHLETAYFQMWERHQREESPCSFNV